MGASAHDTKSDVYKSHVRYQETDQTEETEAGKTTRSFRLSGRGLIARVFAVRI